MQFELRWRWCVLLTFLVLKIKKKVISYFFSTPTRSWTLKSFAKLKRKQENR